MSSEAAPEADGCFWSVPEAAVTHPWWGSGKRGYLHFLSWARGDGRLMDLYPGLTFMSCPNVAECILVAVALALAIVLRNLVRGTPLHLLEASLLPLGVLESEILADVVKHMVLDPSRLPELGGWRRCLASAESSLVILALETGRMLGHWERRRWLHHFCRRFEWFCGRVQGAVSWERRVACLKVLGHIVWGALLLWTVSGARTGTTGQTFVALIWTSHAVIAVSVTCLLVTGSRR